jgi:hypothetical protein
VLIESDGVWFGLVWFGNGERKRTVLYCCTAIGMVKVKGTELSVLTARKDMAMEVSVRLLLTVR